LPDGNQGLFVGEARMFDSGLHEADHSYYIEMIKRS